MCVYVCGRNTGHCACISPQLGLASLSPLYLLIHAWRLLYLMPMHHIYICLHIASLGLLVLRRGELTCVHLYLLWMLEPDSYLDCDWSAAGHVTRPGAGIGWMLEPDGWVTAGILMQHGPGTPSVSNISILYRKPSRTSQHVQAVLTKIYFLWVLMLFNQSRLFVVTINLAIFHFLKLSFWQRKFLYGVFAAADQLLHTAHRLGTHPLLYKKPLKRRRRDSAEVIAAGWWRWWW